MKTFISIFSIGNLPPVYKKGDFLILSGDKGLEAVEDQNISLLVGYFPLKWGSCDASEDIRYVERTTWSDCQNIMALIHLFDSLPDKIPTVLFAYDMRALALFCSWYYNWVSHLIDDHYGKHIFDVGVSKNSLRVNQKDILVASKVFGNRTRYHNAVLATIEGQSMKIFVEQAGKEGRQWSGVVFDETYHHVADILKGSEVVT